MNRNDLYLRKNDYENYTNSVFEKIRETENYTIVKEIDTITEEEDFKAIKTLDFKENYYKLNELLNRNNYVNEIGYFEDMSQLEIFIYVTFRILFMDEDNILIEERITNRVFVQTNIYDTEFNHRYNIKTISIPNIKKNKIKNNLDF